MMALVLKKLLKVIVFKNRNQSKSLLQQEKSLKSSILCGLEMMKIYKKFMKKSKITCLFRNLITSNLLNKILKKVFKS